jgi:hypothetical protein
MKQNLFGKGNCFSFFNIPVLLFSIFLSSSSFLNAQNLVGNPSFETGAWPDANSGSADWLTGPSNVFGVENAYLGTRYMGISMGESTVAGGSDFREYVKSPLSSALVIGNTYEVSIMVSLSENYGDYGCNRIGFGVSVANPFFAMTQGPVPMTAVYAGPTVITNKIGWTQVGGTFVATSAAAYVVIGNFHTQATRTFQYVGPGGWYYGYYFLDQGCLGPPGTCNIPLPIEFLDFTAKRENGIPVLNWSTACSMDCDQFVVERSTQGVDFEPVAMVEAGNSNEARQEYDFTDQANKNDGIVYYRIKVIEKNGKRNYSNMVALDLSATADPHMAVYPVPSNGEITFDLTPVEKNASFKLYDQTGKIIFEKNISGPEKINLNNLAAGSYFAIIMDENGQYKRRRFIITGNE